MSGGRTREKSESQYDRAWDDALAIIRRRILDGERDPCRLADAAWAGIGNAFLAGRPFREYYARLGLACDEAGRPQERLAVADGVYEIVPFDQARRGTVVETLLEDLEDAGIDSACVVELGSGIGRNLFYLFDEIRKRSSIDVEFHACELTQSGREATRTIARTASGMNLSVHPFDYYAPDLSFLEGKACVHYFTVHSIEQIPLLGRKVFEEMLRWTPHCSCRHFEPVGWQFNPKLVEERRAADTALGRLRRSFARHRRKVQKFFDRKSVFGFPGITIEREDIGRADRIDENAAQWSSAADYNKDLLAVVKEMESEGKLEIRNCLLNAFGENPFNPTTIIRWSSARPPR